MSCFLVQIKAFVVFNLAEIANFKNEWKNEHHLMSICKWPVIKIVNRTNDIKIVNRTNDTCWREELREKL